jgi:hypothetical protein
MNGPSSICPRCQAPNRCDARFCGGCGAQIPQSKFCGACGKQNSLQARFCGECAKPFEATHGPRAASQAETRAAIADSPREIQTEASLDRNESNDRVAAGKDFLRASTARIGAALRGGGAFVARSAKEKPYVVFGAAAAAGVVLIAGIVLLFWHGKGTPATQAAQEHGIAGSPSGTQYAIRLTHVRNGPTSIGTNVLEDVQAGEAVSGIWVIGHDGVTNWLRITRPDGSAGFLWGSNLSPVPPSRPAPGASFGEFAAYPVSIYSGAAASPDFRNAPASFRRFRTVIRQGAAAGVNFAGHYAIITFGCGTDCSNSVVVDEQSGSIFDFPLGGEAYYNLALQYRLDSQLLVAQWQVDPMTAPICVREEFLLVGTAFNALRKMQQPGTCPL